MSKISFYDSFVCNGRSVELSEILNAIRDGEFKEQVETLRGSKDDPKRYANLKRLLPHFSPSAVFGAARRVECLKEYNPLIVLDIDHVGFEKAKHLRDGLFLMSHTLAAFLSPGGDGLKILVLTDSTKETHERVFKEVAEFYEKYLGVTIDRTGKDITRACFVSYDPEIWINETAIPFKSLPVTADEVKIVPRKSAVEPYPMVWDTNGLDDESLFSEALRFTEQIDVYLEGNRNNFIYKLANNLNRMGMDVFTAMQMVYGRYHDLSYREVTQAVKSAYKNYGEHNMYGDGCCCRDAIHCVSEPLESVISKPLESTIQEPVESNVQEDAGAGIQGDATCCVSTANTATAILPFAVISDPLIPDEVYGNLPELLRKGTAAFENQRERDVFLTGAFAILSGCFNNVRGLYNKAEYSPNIFCFIIAPPASGKGVLKYSRCLAEAIHEKIKQDYGVGATGQSSLRPRTHFLCGDTSSAAIKKLMIHNGGQGTICETEADTLSSSLQQDWGGFDDLLRKAFHHETVAFSRMSKNPDDYDEVVVSEVKEPRLSICLSGTPSQAPALIKGTENGLFSRILFYNYRPEGEPEFMDVFSGNGIDNLNEYFEGLSREVLQMYSTVKETGRVNFQLTRAQEEQFRWGFDKNLKRLNRDFGEETRGIVFRLGLITFRIAMILTIVRSFEEGTFSEEIICSDSDFKSSMILSDIYLEHSLAVLQTMPDTRRINPKALKLLRSLPYEFNHKDLLESGTTKCGFSERSIYYYLKLLIRNKYLARSPREGMYMKI